MYENRIISSFGPQWVKHNKLIMENKFFIQESLKPENQARSYVPKEDLLRAISHYGRRKGQLTIVFTRIDLVI